MILLRPRTHTWPGERLTSRHARALGTRTSLGRLENLASSGLMVGLINVLVGGAFVFTVLLNMGVEVGVARTIGALSAIGLGMLAFGVIVPRVGRQYEAFESRFPTPPEADS